jgi:membrane protease YdiL (CAAX protease family)
MEILKKYKIREIIIFILVISLFYFSPYLQYIPIYIMHWDVHNLSDKHNIFLSLFSSVCLAIIYFIFYFKALKKDFKIFTKDIMKNINTAFCYWLVGFAIMAVSNIIINVILGGGIAGNEEQVRGMVKVLPWIMIINAGLIAPFNEEIIFRKSLRDIFDNKWLFVFASFLLFGGAHILGNISSWVDILYIIPYGVLGGVFALAYYKTNTIFTSICMHMFHNIMAVLLLIFII